MELIKSFDTDMLTLADLRNEDGAIQQRMSTLIMDKIYRPFWEKSLSAHSDLASLFQTSPQGAWIRHFVIDIWHTLKLNEPGIDNTGEYDGVKEVCGKIKKEAVEEEEELKRMVEDKEEEEDEDKKEEKEDAEKEEIKDGNAMEEDKINEDELRRLLIRRTNLHLRANIDSIVHGMFQLARGASQEAILAKFQETIRKV